VPSRRGSKWTQPARPLGSGSNERVERWCGEPYRVRAVSGQAGSGGPYRCPGCDQLLSGVPHIVAWPDGDLDAGDRRHWHTGCWSARESRRPGVLRSRNAPRYG